MRRILYSIVFLLFSLITVFLLASITSSPIIRAELSKLKNMTENYYFPGTIEIFVRQTNKDIVGICGKIDYKAKAAAISNVASRQKFDHLFKHRMVYFDSNSGRGGRSKILFEINKALQRSTARFFVEQDGRTVYATADDSGGFCSFRLVSLAGSD